jgi:15-cis-phytoene synthase
MPTLSPDDLAGCRALLHSGSRSFFAASLLLPRRVREPATALYAFCRMADDAVDGQAGGAAATMTAAAAPALADLADRLDRIYAGRPRDALVDRAFAATVEAHAIPRSLPEALLEGFAWDVAGRRYADAIDLEGYAVRVAGTVGMMMTLLMGRSSETALARAADLGIAMQFTNIARDVGEDAAAGRLYLPLEWLAEEGIDPDRFLAQPVASPALGRVVARLLALADHHYGRAAGGVALLPADCRPAIHAARLVYREIGRSLSRGGLDPVGARTVVPSGRKLGLIAAACAVSLVPRHASPGPPAETARLLVRHAAASAPPPKDGPIGRLIDIMTALDRRQQARQASLRAPARVANR